MKIRIWTAIIDGGDGTHIADRYKSAQEIKDSLGIVEDVSEITKGAVVFDEYDYPVEISVDIFDTEGYEEVL